MLAPMPVVLIVLGFGLVGVGLVFAFGGVASDRAGGEAMRGIRLEGPAWLILVGLGVGVILFGVWRFDTNGGDEPPVDDGDAFLDDLWDSCAVGDWPACNELYLWAPIESDYELFGASCGGVIAGSLQGLQSSGVAGNC